ncbi:conserved hypothetical protein [Cyanobium sp. PCC 7001]|uniref:hypothetical protein n=1 Tax=Cyanobium sp. PCC 7001 TaxID=180281 RepID=UPI00018052E7|nr:hypothetical protein [Cyanobium sp. PCC 7001]EDY37337.1 conserved hypothetical protein [Cyanobium sp. PCC 7001]
MSAAIDDAPWFKVLLVLRWPCALVLSSIVLGGVLLRVLSRPIPIRLAMPLDQPLAVKAQVDELAKPIHVEQLNRAIEISAKELLTVKGTVGVDASKPIPITGQPRVVVTSPVEVKAGTPLPVQGSVAVKAEDTLPVQVEGDVKVDTPEPLKVETDVKLDTYDEPVQIQVKEGLMGIF